VGAQPIRPPRQQEARAALVVRQQHQGHRGRAPLGRRMRSALEAGQVRARPRPQPLVKF
jgi:hypothetical protein